MSKVIKNMATVKTKRCSKCKRELPLDAFNKNKRSNDGLGFWCKACMKTYYKEKHPGVKQYLTYDQVHRTIGGINQKFCTRCSAWKPISEFNKNRTRRDGLCDQCRECWRAYLQSPEGKAYGKEYRQTHKSEAAEYRRIHKNKTAEYDKKYRQSPTGKIVRARAINKYRKTFRGHLYWIFNSGMMQRCYNSNGVSYKNYGGRGIEVRCTFSEFYYHITVTLGYDTYEKIEGLQVDRIDTNGHYELENIRIVTSSQNNMNSRKPSHHRGQPCSSRFKGVSRDKRRKKWQVRITANRKQYHLGYFTDGVEAAMAYDRKAIELFGEFACTNRMLGLLD